MRGMLQRRGTCSPSPERLRVVREMQPCCPGPRAQLAPQEKQAERSRGYAKVQSPKAQRWRRGSRCSQGR